MGSSGSGGGFAGDREIWRNEYADSKRSLDYRNLAGVSIHDDVGIDVMLNPQRTKNFRSDRDGNILGMKNKDTGKSKHSLSLLSGGGSQVGSQLASGGSQSNLQSGATGTTTKTISHLHQHHLESALNNSDLVISDSIGGDGFLQTQSPSKNRGKKNNNMGASGSKTSNYSPNKLLQQTGLGSLDSSVVESPGRMSTRSSKNGAMSATSRGGFGVGGGHGGLHGSGSSFQFRTPKLTKAKPLPPRVPTDLSTSPEKKGASQFSSTHSAGFGISQSSPNLDPGSPFGGSRMRPAGPGPSQNTQSKFAPDTNVGRVYALSGGDVRLRASEQSTILVKTMKKMIDNKYPRLSPEQEKEIMGMLG
jgi:hypothetical protein